MFLFIDIEGSTALAERLGEFAFHRLVNRFVVDDAARTSHRREGNVMSENRNTGTFSAADLRRRMAEREAAKAAEEMRRLKEQQEKQKTVMEEFHKPPDRTPKQVTELVMQLVDRAAERGHSEVQVYRFPNSLCTDHGRRINNSEPDWDQTLEGRPRAGYEFWRDHLRPLGFHLRAQVLEYPGGMPGDIGFFLTW